MLQTEIITVRGKQYRRTYSDANKYIQNENGDLYEDAVDPLDSTHTYTETDIDIKEYDENEADTNITE